MNVAQIAATHKTPCTNGIHTHQMPMTPCAWCVTQNPAPLAEAPCSMNTVVEAPGLGRVQVTGRGTTPAEAAANLRGQVEALLPTPAPAPRLPQRLGVLLACGIEKALAAGDLGRIDKLSKAAALVLSGAVQPGEREGTTAVRSLSNPDQWYLIDEEQRCSCPDYAHRHKEGEQFYCKHLLSVLMTQRLAE